MADTTINFNPIKFAGGLTKSFVSATMQSISSYMPFTSDVLSDASDKVFNIKQYIAENRPDRTSRNESGVLRMMANKTLNASRTFLSDLSHGDISFKQTRQGMIGYLKKNTQSEFDFDFDFDFDDEDNGSAPEERQFTVEDYAEGVYESTMATVGAIEASTNKMALMQAKSNNILGDRLIANNMTSMAQTMQMLSTMNENISGVNTNLASLVEYNNTTMNDFIKNTTTHFAKVESFMDMISKRYESEDKDKKASNNSRNNQEDNKVFTESGINFGNLFKKAILTADSEFGTMGMIGSITKLIATSMLGADKLPKFLQDLEGPDLSTFVEMINPAKMLTDIIFPEFSKLAIVDRNVKGIASLFRRKLSTDRSKGGFFDGNNKLGSFLLKLFSDEDDMKYYEGAKNKKASWMTSDSEVLQHVIPSFISETNNSLNYMNSNVMSIVRLMEITTRELTSFHEDSLRGYRYMISNIGGGPGGGPGGNGAAKRRNNAIRTLENREIHARNRRRANDRKFNEIRETETAKADQYRDEHKLIYDADEMVLRTYGDVIEDYKKNKQRAYTLGSDDLSAEFYKLITKNGDISDIDATYGEKTSERVTRILDDIIGVEALVNENPEFVKDHKLDAAAITSAVFERLENMGVFDEKILNGSNRVKIYSAIEEISERRAKAIDKLNEKNAKNTTLHAVLRAERGRNYSFYDVFGGEDIREMRIDPKYKDLFKPMVLKDDYAIFKMAADAPLLDAKSRGIREGSDEYNRIKADCDRRYNEMVKAAEKKKNSPYWKLLVAQNPPNMYASALFDTINEYLGSAFSVLLSKNDETGGNLIEQMRDAITDKAVGEAFETLAFNYGERQGRYTVYFDGEGHRGQRWYDKAHWGQYKEVDSEGNDLGWQPDEEYEDIKRRMEALNYFEDPESHRFVKYKDDGTKEYAPEQYVQPTLGSFATGATRIDHDQVAQVHEGEMILDRSLSETVRDNIANMIKAGGVSKLSDDQYKELIKSISDSDERYKGHEEEVIKDINRAIDQYDIKDITKVELSKESVCLIDVDENETFSSLMAKKLTEIAINLGIMTRSTLNRDAEEVEADNKNKAKKGGGFLFGSKNDQGMYTDGFFSKEVNRIKDEFNYWRFSKLDGKEYTGYTRDKAGNIIEGSGTKKYTVAEDDPETLLKTFRNYARQNAANFADKQGFDAERKKQYLESIDRLVDGVPGALKGGVAGLALSAVFGGFAPAIGMLGGFAFSNKETKEFIFGKTVTDENGRKHVEGGLFGGFMNKLTEMGDEIKYNFKTIFSDTASNVKLGLKHFIDKLTNTDNDSIKDGVKKFMDEIAGGKEGSFATKLLSGILNTTRKVAEGASDIAIDSITIGSKLMFKAASLPFNAFASIIGGKDYRDEKRKEKRAARSKELKGLYDELIRNDALIGINPMSHLETAWMSWRRGLAEENRMIKEGKGPRKHRHFGGKGGWGYDDLPSLKSIMSTEIKPLSFLDTEIKQLAFMDKIPGDIKEGGKNIFEKISDGITNLNNSVTGDFAQNALRGVVGAILAGPLAMTGHPILAASVLGAGMSSAIAKQIFGTGILGVFSSGLKLLGERISTPFKRVGEYFGNRAHFLKESLGIHDNKFYIKRMTKGSHLDRANILGDLGYSPEEQEEYFKVKAKSPSELTSDDKKLISRVEHDVQKGYRDNSQTILDIKHADERYDELRNKKDLTDKEKAELKELQKGVASRRWDLYKNTTLAAERFGIKHGYSAKRRLKNLNSISPTDYKNAKATIDFNSTLTTNITDDMFNAMGITDEGRRIEIQKEMDKNLKKVRDQVISKYGSLDAAKDHPEELKDIIMNSALAKNEGAFKDRTGDEIVSFLRNGGIEQAQQEQNFRDKISTEVTDIHTVLNTMWESLKNTVVKFFEKKVPDRMDSAHSKDEEKKEEESKSESISQENKPANANTNEPEKKSFAETYADNLKENLKERVLEATDPTGAVESIIDSAEETSSNPLANYAANVNAGANIAGSKLSGAMNIPADAVYQLHAGEMVLDPKTAEAFRQNIAGGGIADVKVFNEMNASLKSIAGSFKSGSDNSNDEEGGIKGIFSSMKNSLGGLLNVFTGDKSGSKEDKKSFIDKMKEGIASVGDKISGSVLGSGLIPLKADGSVDVGRIVARLVALIGGAVLAAPLIKKAAEKLGPFIEPLFSGISSVVSNILSTSLSSIGSLLTNIAPDIIAGLTTFGENLRQGIVDALKTIRFNVSVQGIGEQNEEDNKPENLTNPDITGKIKDDIKDTYTETVKAQSPGATSEEVDSYMEMISSKEIEFSQACSAYYTAMINFCTNNFYVSDTLASGIIGNTVRAFTGSYAPVTDTADEIFYKYLTNKELQFFKNARKDMTTATMENFGPVIQATTSIHVYYDSTLGAFHIGKNKDDTSQTRLNDIEYSTNRIQKIHDRITVLSTHTGDNFLAKQQVQGFHGVGDSANVTSANTNDDAIGYGYVQNDPRWSRQRYGNFKSGNASTLGAGGCGPTAMANVYSNLTGKSINPAQMARFSQINGYNAQGGTSAGLFTAGARKLGLASNAISKSGRSIRDSIRSGKNVIIAGKNGPYTRSGHIMSVRGVDSRGNAIVDDPLKRGARRIPMRNLTKGMTHAWSIGYGTGTVAGQSYQTWDDVFTDGTATFNRTGGSFGYVDGYNGMANACIYNSFVNGYLNAVLGNDSFESFVNANGWSPASLHSSKTVTQFSGSGGVNNYDILANELSNIIGRSVSIRYADISDPKKDAANLDNFVSMIYNNLKSGNPILFSVNNATPGKDNTSTPLGKASYITASYDGNSNIDNATPTKFHYQHGVLLAGMHTDADGNGYVVIADPGRSGINQVHKMSLSKFTDAVKETNTKPYIHRVVVFNKNSVEPSHDEMEFNNLKDSIAAGNHSDRVILESKYPGASGCNSYFEWYSKYHKSDTSLTGGITENATASVDYSSGLNNTASTGSAKFTDLRQETNDTTVGDWFATLIDKFTQFGTNLIGAALSGDTSNLYTAQSSSDGSAGGAGYNGSGGSGGVNGSGYGTNSTPILVIDAAYVKSLIDSAYQSYANNTDINAELGKNGFGMYSITKANYDKLTSNPSYSTILMLISSSSKYKEYVVQTMSSIYTWVLALQVAEIVKTNKSYNESDKQKFNSYKAMINQVGGEASITAFSEMQKEFGTNAVDYENYDDYIIGITSKDKYSTANNRFTAQVDQKAAALYSRFKSIELFVMGTPTSDYSMIPAWAKDPNSRVPDVSGTNISNSLLTKMIEYIHPVISASETGVWRDSIDKLSQEDLRNLYYNAIRLDNEKYVTIGRGGFYGPTATSVFNKLTNAGSPLTEDQKAVASTLANMFSNTSTSASEVNSLLSAHQDLYPYLMSAEDAKAIELVNEYFARSLDGYKRQGLSDPRAVILSSGFAGVAPARVNGASGYPSWYRFTTNTPDQLNQLKTTMVSDSWTMPNSGKYGDGWQNRITGIYNMLTTDNGYYPNIGKYLPLPSAITSAIPSNMNNIPAGYGDAGYNMRDNFHMYTDDVYMGDADNPMHVILDQSPVTSRIDKLIELVDSAVNSKPEFKAGPSDAISSSIGTGPETFSTTKTGSSKGATNTAKVDKLAQIHSKIAKRTRVTTNYNHM